MVAGKRIIRSLFVTLCITLFVYTVIISQIDVSGSSQSVTLPAGETVAFYEPYKLFVVPGSSHTPVIFESSSPNMNLTEWIGYSKSKKGIIYFDDDNNQVGVLRINTDTRKAQTTIIGSAAKPNQGNWGIDDDTLSRIDASSGALLLESIKLSEIAGNNSVHKTKLTYRVAAGSDMRWISKPSVRQGKAVFDISSIVWLANIRTGIMQKIGNGDDPVFISNDVVAYGFLHVSENSRKKQMCFSKKQVCFETFQQDI